MAKGDIVHELKRLADNQQALLEGMPEMVLLVNADKAIEYMNPSALTFFGDLREKSGTLDFSQKQAAARLLNLVNTSIKNNRSTDVVNDIVGESHLEFFVAPFLGYKGDSLYWLTLRDLTEQKKHQEELAKFHTNIESILAYKINELKESERIRKSLATSWKISNITLKAIRPKVR